MLTRNAFPGIYSPAIGPHDEERFGAGEDRRGQDRVRRVVLRERSTSQAKNRTNGRQPRIGAWSRIVPSASQGDRASIASSTGPDTSRAPGVTHDSPVHTARATARWAQRDPE